MLYAATNEEVREKDLTGKYFTPYGYINPAVEGTPAGDEVLAGVLWKRSAEICARVVPGWRGGEGL